MTDFVKRLFRRQWRRRPDGKSNIERMREEETPSTWDLIEHSKACPHCGATWQHKHYYPMPINPNLQHDENNNFWTWKPTD